MDWQKLLTNKRLRPSTRVKDTRSEFESDYGRIIFSPATRRMHSKTQVFPLTDNDNIHSRLTHSLEVMSVGYSLSILFCESRIFQEKTGKSNYEMFREIPIILQNSCLIHDIGNPPYGHFGETVIQEYFKKFFTQGSVPFQLTAEQQRDFIHFDGNAQGLRVLTKLQSINDIYGLNLTCTTLAACIKYPNYGDIVKTQIERKKVGVFQSEVDFLNRIADECGLRVGGRIIRHPLCYLVEAADSICYLTMDLEDGFNKHLYTLDELRERIQQDFPPIDEIIERDIPDRAKITIIRNSLISELVKLAFNSFEAHIEDIENGTFNKELIFFASPLADHLQQFCIEKIFSIPAIYRLELVGHSVITWLLDFFIGCLRHPNKNYRERCVKMLSDSILQIALTENGCSKFEELPDYYQLRVIVDNIAGMTDRYALNLYRKLKGE